MKYYYVYKITNRVNGKIYIGKRTTRIKPENDKYLGSGKMIKRAVLKYGSENFHKEILEMCSKDNLSEREIHYIELYDCRDNNIGYNIIEGGYGVGDLCHDRITYYNPETNEEIRLQEGLKPPEGFTHGRRPFTKEAIEKMTRRGKDNGMYGIHRYGKDNPFYGCKHSPEVINKFKNRRWAINPITKERKSVFINSELPRGFMYVSDYKEQIKLRKELSVPKNRTNTRGSNMVLSNKKKEYWANKKDEVCPYCGKTGKGVGFYKWHMDNCKQHPMFGKLNEAKHKHWTSEQGYRNKNKAGTTTNKICINNGLHNKFIYEKDLPNYPDYNIGMIKRNK